ncbi:hypothetical protein FS749_011225 [Ceratobasidium sp. UAMH 11750]|nr:hypothetical protein FS749_011225 [Ceratobasidium sp. UAMH 11750]
MLGLGGRERHQRWLQIRCAVRDLVTRANLHIELMWTRQDTVVIMLLYQSLRKAIPELDRARNNWIAQYLSREAFTHRRNHWLARQKEQGGNPDGRGGSGSADRTDMTRPRKTIWATCPTMARTADGSDVRLAANTRLTGLTATGGVVRRTMKKLPVKKPPPPSRPRPRMRVPQSPGLEPPRSAPSPARPNPESGAPTPRQPTASTRPERSSGALPSRQPATPPARPAPPPPAPPTETTEPRTSARVAANAAKKAAAAEQARQTAEATRDAEPATKKGKTTQKLMVAAKPKGKGKAKQPGSEEEGEPEDPDRWEDNGAEEELSNSYPKV